MKLKSKWSQIPTNAKVVLKNGVRTTTHFLFIAVFYYGMGCTTFIFFQADRTQRWAGLIEKLTSEAFEYHDSLTNDTSELVLPQNIEEQLNFFEEKVHFKIINLGFNKELVLSKSLTATWALIANAGLITTLGVHSLPPIKISEHIVTSLYQPLGTFLVFGLITNIAYLLTMLLTVALNLLSVKKDMDNYRTNEATMKEHSNYGGRRESVYGPIFRNVLDKVGARIQNTESSDRVGLPISEVSSPTVTESPNTDESQFESNKNTSSVNRAFGKIRARWYWNKKRLNVNTNRLEVERKLRVKNTRCNMGVSRQYSSKDVNWHSSGARSPLQGNASADEAATNQQDGPRRRSVNRGVGVIQRHHVRDALGMSSRPGTFKQIGGRLRDISPCLKSQPQMDNIGLRDKEAFSAENSCRLSSFVDSDCLHVDKKQSARITTERTPFTVFQSPLSISKNEFDVFSNTVSNTSESCSSTSSVVANENERNNVIDVVAHAATRGSYELSRNAERDFNMHSNSQEEHVDQLQSNSIVLHPTSQYVEKDCPNCNLAHDATKFSSKVTLQQNMPKKMRRFHRVLGIHMEKSSLSSGSGWVADDLNFSHSTDDASIDHKHNKKKKYCRRARWRFKKHLSRLKRSFVSREKVQAMLVMQKDLGGVDAECFSLCSVCYHEDALERWQVETLHLMSPRPLEQLIFLFLLLVHIFVTIVILDGESITDASRFAQSLYSNCLSFFIMHYNREVGTSEKAKNDTMFALPLYCIGWILLAAVLQFHPMFFVKVPKVKLREKVLEDVRIARQQINHQQKNVYMDPNVVRQLSLMDNRFLTLEDKFKSFSV